MSISKLIFFLLGIAALLFMALLLGTQELGQALSRVSPLAVAVLFTLQLSTLLVSAWIWHFLLNRKSSITFSAVFLVNQAAGLIESLTPSVKFGGEAAKVYLFRQRTGQAYQELAGTLFVHKFLTMTPFVLLCLVLVLPSFFMFELPVYFYVALAVLTAMCAGLGLLCYGKDGEERKASPLQDPLEKSVPGRLEYLKKLPSRVAVFLQQSRLAASRLLSTRQLLAAMLVSLLIWVFYPIKVYLACTFLGLEVHPLIIGLATLFAYMVSMVPLLPGGLGTYEGTMALFFTIGGLTPAEGLAVSLLSRLTTFWFPLFISALSCLALSRTSPLLPEQSGIQEKQQAKQTL
ncbi:flippase-like domain-containing protein [Desulfonatronospira sp.]|uniref:lysylphosphatidylglycerol synthase transmembrane domain-containing protein n=1 Tax=Desulfonatronospira sp. TaxID=1962951 RepID=UPI0025BA9D68|nr:flippase-like domain-containing protein [Desulfonatronospira sp.]